MNLWKILFIRLMRDEDLRIGQERQDLTDPQDECLTNRVDSLQMSFRSHLTDPAYFFSYATLTHGRRE